MTDRNPARRMRARGGHTLIELMIALVIGVSLLMSASAVAISTMRSMRGAELREGVARQARYVGMSLERDLAFTGVELESTAIHGAVYARDAMFEENIWSGNQNVSYSRCAIENALRGSAILTRVKERHWSMLY